MDVHLNVSGFNRLDVEVFVNKNQGIPSVIKFHPYEGHVAVADKDGIWSVSQGSTIVHVNFWFGLANRIFLYLMKYQKVYCVCF